MAAAVARGIDGEGPEKRNPSGFGRVTRRSLISQAEHLLGFGTLPA
jgi:hypothetical protein